MGQATLYMLKGSHPANAGRLMLETKGIDFKIVDMDLIAGVHDLRLKAAGFKGGTVPALKISGRKVQGTREIARALDEIQAEPPLFPKDPGQRAEVEAAEAWGHDVLQPVPRRLIRASMRHNAGARRWFMGYMGLPKFVAPATVPVISRIAKAVGARPDTAQADLAAVREHIDHVGELLAQGVIGGSPLNAADCQIAPSVRFLLAFEDVRPLIDGTPAADYARRILPEYIGPLPVGTIPAIWLPQAG